MENKNETQVEETTTETTEESTETEVETKEADSTDWKAEASKYKRMAEQRGKKLEKYASVHKEEEVSDQQQSQDKKVSQSNEPDYGRLSYLETKGVNHPDDQKIAMDEAARLKLPLTEILQMEHIKGRLQANKDQREAQAGISIKGGKRTGGSTQHDVEYWLARPDERPADQEMAAKVLNAKMAKEASANRFSDVMYNDQTDRSLIGSCD